MEDFLLVAMPEMVAHIIDNESYNDDFMVADIGKLIGAEEVVDSPIRLDSLMIILMQEGAVDIKIDYVQHRVEANTVVIIMPTHIVQPVNGSAGMKGRMIVSSKNFLHKFHSAEQVKPSMLHYMQMKKNPCTSISPEEMAHLDAGFLNIKEMLRKRTHFFYSDIIQIAFISFLLEMGNIFAGKRELLPMSPLSRKEELFDQFLRLLNQYCWKERSVSFYANELCITPQYLSLILKSLSGKSANRWIEEALMIEAKMLLRTPNTNVQQVADKLSFPDQSTFGKFFKKNMGISPSEYRKTRKG